MPLPAGGRIMGKGQGLPSSPTICGFKIPLAWHHQL